MNRKTYWETICATKAPNEVSWYQASPDLSLALIAATGAGKDARIIDIGGGASRLVDALLGAAFELVDTRIEQHLTPSNVRHSFLYARFKKRR